MKNYKNGEAIEGRYQALTFHGWAGSLEIGVMKGWSCKLHWIP